MKQELWWMDHSPHMQEGINNDKVNIVKCNDHYFGHGLSNIGFHFQFKKTMLSIQI